VWVARHDGIDVVCLGKREQVELGGGDAGATKALERSSAGIHQHARTVVEGQHIARGGAS
jgi:hypothetical protein